MADRLFLEKILKQYELLGYSGDFEWMPVPEYPHIVKITIDQDTYYLKKAAADDSKREWLEKVYSLLNGEYACVHPVKNASGRYLTEGYLLTREMEPCTENLMPEWWACCLAAVHGKTDMLLPAGSTLSQLRGGPLQERILLPDYESTMAAWSRVSGQMENDVRNLLETFIRENEDCRIEEMSAALVHGDPLCSNVMREEAKDTLFDFESSGFSVPEYDVQRLFADIAVSVSHENEIDAFIYAFLNEYGHLGGKPDAFALDYIFRLDLIRTMCWLYETSAACDRQDYKRQASELEKYKKALRKGWFHRVIAVINGTYPFDLSNIRIHHQDEIFHTASLIYEIVPDFVCATLGGSRSHFLDDSCSDVEMYFYSKTGIPSVENINRVLEEAGAIHKRSDSFLWNEEPWGPHSFFVLGGIYYEIGYRVLKETEGKIQEYLSGKMVEPQKDCHDLGLGYMYSGLAASIQAEKIILCRDPDFFELKNLTAHFPETLQNALVEEYWKTAENLLKGKLFDAAERQDTFLYNVLSTRVIRCLMIMAFSVTGTHFPGDKWNEVLLLQTGWKKAEQILQLLNTHMRLDADCIEKYKILWEVYGIIDQSGIMFS